jgi:hypothetical protein
VTRPDRLDVFRRSAGDCFTTALLPAAEPGFQVDSGSWSKIAATVGDNPLPIGRRIFSSAPPAFPLWRSATVLCDVLRGSYSVVL